MPVESTTNAEESVDTPVTPTEAAIPGDSALDSNASDVSAQDVPASNAIASQWTIHIGNSPQILKELIDYLHSLGIVVDTSSDADGLWNINLKNASPSLVQALQHLSSAPSTKPWTIDLLNVSPTFAEEIKAIEAGGSQGVHLNGDIPVGVDADKWKVNLQNAPKDLLDIFKIADPIEAGIAKSVESTQEDSDDNDDNDDNDSDDNDDNDSDDNDDNDSDDNDDNDSDDKTDDDNNDDSESSVPNDDDNDDDDDKDDDDDNDDNSDEDNDDDDDNSDDDDDDDDDNSDDDEDDDDDDAAEDTNDEPADGHLTIPPVVEQINPPITQEVTDPVMPTLPMVEPQIPETLPPMPQAMPSIPLPTPTIGAEPALPIQPTVPAPTAASAPAPSPIPHGEITHIRIGAIHGNIHPDGTLGKDIGDVDIGFGDISGKDLEDSDQVIHLLEETLHNIIDGGSSKPLPAIAKPKIPQPSQSTGESHGKPSVHKSTMAKPHVSIPSQLHGIPISFKAHGPLAAMAQKFPFLKHGVPKHMHIPMPYGTPLPNHEPILTRPYNSFTFPKLVHQPNSPSRLLRVLPHFGNQFPMIFQKPRPQGNVMPALPTHITSIHAIPQLVHGYPGHLPAAPTASNSPIPSHMAPQVDPMQVRPLMANPDLDEHNNSPLPNVVGQAKHIAHRSPYMNMVPHMELPLPEPLVKQQNAPHTNFEAHPHGPIPSSMNPSVPTTLPAPINRFNFVSNHLTTPINNLAHIMPGFTPKPLGPLTMNSPNSNSQINPGSSSTVTTINPAQPSVKNLDSILKSFAGSMPNMVGNIANSLTTHIGNMPKPSGEIQNHISTFFHSLPELSTNSVGGSFKNLAPIVHQVSGQIGSSSGLINGLSGITQSVHNVAANIGNSLSTNFNGNIHFGGQISNMANPSGPTMPTINNGFSNMIGNTMHTTMQANNPYGSTFLNRLPYNSQVRVN
ncbi:uncharacterized protein LOC142229367 [Haematobia irritans]|uniref:uncharacterized protein LOC142229367 n=1 Tax=Haematobia irritans TaxID=7368 RepID=UPI003F50873E